MKEKNDKERKKERKKERERESDTVEKKKITAPAQTMYTTFFE